jgi:hypothetical protein
MIETSMFILLSSLQRSYSICYQRAPVQRCAKSDWKLLNTSCRSNIQQHHWVKALYSLLVTSHLVLTSLSLKRAGAQSLSRRIWTYRATFLGSSVRRSAWAIYRGSHIIVDRCNWNFPLSSQIVHVHRRSARDATFAELAKPLPAVLSRVIQSLGIEHLYTHQVSKLTLKKK